MSVTGGSDSPTGWGQALLPVHARAGFGARHKQVPAEVGQRKMILYGRGEAASGGPGGLSVLWRCQWSPSLLCVSGQSGHLVSWVCFWGGQHLFPRRS